MWRLARAVWRVRVCAFWSDRYFMAVAARYTLLNTRDDFFRFLLRHAIRLYFGNDPGFAEKPRAVKTTKNARSPFTYTFGFARAYALRTSGTQIPPHGHAHGAAPGSGVGACGMARAFII